MHLFIVDTHVVSKKLSNEVLDGSGKGKNTSDNG